MLGAVGATHDEALGQRALEAIGLCSARVAAQRQSAESFFSRVR